MMQRCYNPNCSSFGHYGGRGIGVCQPWHKFETFYNAMGDPPEGMELERIDNDGDYGPQNVKWDTRKAQTRNTRQNRLITYAGETLCLSDWSLRTGIGRDTLAARCRDGWPVKRMLTEPVIRGRKHTEAAKAKMRKPKPPRLKQSVINPQIVIT